MSQIPSQPEDKTDLAPTQAAAAAAPVRTGNLADTNSDEYKHKHGEHHHHHHHHHRHHHFHLLNFSVSGIRDNIKLLFKTVYAYPYILLALSLVFLFIMNSGLVLSQLNAHQKSFSSSEIFYRWQEYLVMNKALLVRIPFQVTLVVSGGIALFLMRQQERHWQRNVLKFLPALGAALIFSIPMNSARPAEDFARSACRDSLLQYYDICSKYAKSRNGKYPRGIPRKASIAAKYGSDHYIYHGAGKTTKDEPFILLEDKEGNHIGNYRYAVRNDGVLLVSKYGGLYEEFINEKKSTSIQSPYETEEEDFEWDENLDLFLDDFEGDVFTKVEGTIKERSVLPNPDESDYPNCRFTAHFVGNAIISGQPCPKELNLVIEGFENYVRLDNDKVKNGDKVLCTLIPFNKLSEEEQSTQQADDLELFFLEDYYVIDIKIVNSFSGNELLPPSGIYFLDETDDYISIFDRHINPAIPQKSRYAQNESIQDTLEKMNRMLDGFDETKIRKINEQFAEAWKLEQEKDTPERNRIENFFVWRNLDNSFWTLPQSYLFLQKPDDLSPTILNCFSSLKKALEANGVQLIVSLVPNYHVISSRVINKQFRDIPDLQTATYVKQLSKKGIEVIYASDSIIQNYNKYPFAFFYPLDTHPSDTTQDVISDLLAERLNRYNFPRTLDSNLFSEIQTPHYHKDQEEYLFPENCDIGNNKERKAYTCRKILYNNADISKTKDSPIMVIGNSYIQTPTKVPETLPTLLSYKMCLGIDWYRVDMTGPFSDIIVRLLANPDMFLKNKKVLIIQIGTDHLLNANQKELMLDIAQQDRERILLNNKKMKKHFLFSSNVDREVVKDKSLWGPLSDVDKTVFKIDKNGVLEFSFYIDQADGIDHSKPLICLIPHLCTPRTSCTLIVNDQEKTMHSSSFSDLSKFFNMAFELPAGTKKITIKATGKDGSIFAIKDVQIWQ